MLENFQLIELYMITSINGLSEKWEKFSQDCLDDSSLTIEKGKTFVKIFNEKH